MTGLTMVEGWRGLDWSLGVVCLALCASVCVPVCVCVCLCASESLCLSVLSPCVSVAAPATLCLSCRHCC